MHYINGIAQESKAFAVITIKSERWKSTIVTIVRIFFIKDNFYMQNVYFELTAERLLAIIELSLIWKQKEVDLWKCHIQNREY